MNTLPDFFYQPSVNTVTTAFINEKRMKFSVEFVVIQLEESLQWMAVQHFTKYKGGFRN